jgi:D-sedoheptulose 7-phosphate isomerase
VTARLLDAPIAARLQAGSRYFEREAQALASFCHQMAERFARSGRLIAIAQEPAARSDARHVAVEFVHPVIVGKRALPALALVGAVEQELELIAAAEDVVIAFGPGMAGAVALARARGCLTIAPQPCGAEWEPLPPTEDPYIAQELFETLYHVLWELVHVFFEHRGLLSGRSERAKHDAGASSFLYPFLAEQETDLDAVLEDVRASALMKSDEINALRGQTLSDNGDELQACAALLRERFAAGGKLLALGNGGSATDAMDVVADFRAAGRPAIDLTDDSGILTAIANDIGVEAIFSRQVIAYGTERDALIAISTSGNSGNVIHALAEARRRALATIALVGYDGGRVLAEELADHVIVTRSEHIPRIQEAQASAYHVVRELVG